MHGETVKYSTCNVATFRPPPRSHDLLSDLHTMYSADTY